MNYILCMLNKRKLDPTQLSHSLTENDTKVTAILSQGSGMINTHSVIQIE